MFLSGWVMIYSNFNVSFTSFMESKIKRLVIPFIAWYLFNYIMLDYSKIMTLDDYLLQLIRAPDNGLWYLWILFLCQIILFVSHKLEKYIGDFYLIIIFAIIKIIPLHFLGFDLLKWHFGFFCFGYFISKNRIHFIRYKNIAMIVSTFLFPVLAFGWHRTRQPAMMLYIEKYTTSEISLNIIQQVYNYIVPISGIGFAFFITSLLISHFKKIGNYLSTLGLYTLDIYAIHLYFIGKIVIGNGLTNVFANFLFSLALSLVVSNILRRSSIVSKIFLGIK
jgi:fucose 4-O-acetylase-like acetyltransferase